MRRPPGRSLLDARQTGKGICVQFHHLLRVACPSAADTQLPPRTRLRTPAPNRAVTRLTATPAPSSTHTASAHGPGVAPPPRQGTYVTRERRRGPERPPPLTSSFREHTRASGTGRRLTHMPGGTGTAARLLPWGKGLEDCWPASEVSAEGMGSWAGRRGCSSSGGCRKSGKSVVPSAGGCMASPAGQRGERR